MGLLHRTGSLLGDAFTVQYDKAWPDFHLLGVLCSLKLSETGAIAGQMASSVKAL